MSKNIAIVGIACRFPKAKNKKVFWENLVNGIDAVDIVPKERWDAEKLYSPDIMEQGKTYCKWLGALENIDGFDNNFFNISPREAENMDPGQRLLLQETWHCLEDSSISLEEIQNKVTSVYIGSVAYEPYKTKKIDVSTSNGTYYFMLANKISYYFGLKGASLTLDTGCSSSFMALKMACQALNENSSDYAFVGGVNLHLSPNKLITWAKSRMFSGTGKCHTFDKDADGYVPGEGIGIILLQPLEEAIKCNNKIYAVIRGCAINHGGHALSLTSPNVQAQKSVIRSAYEQTDFTPAQVSYVETHGTGTSLGDPIEIEALTQLYQEYSEEKQFCKIGSVKTNIGHLEGCAAMSGLIKVVLMLKNKRIPKSLNMNIVNPIIELEDSPFVLVNESIKWERLKEEEPLRAGVSSFGLGGTNAHVLLEEYQEQEDKKNDAKLNEEDDTFYFLLSAKNENSLNRIKKEWIENLDIICKNKLSDISYSLLKGRKQFQYRIGGLVRNKEDISNLLLEKENICENKSKKQIISVIGKGDLNEVCDLYKKQEELGLRSDVITAEETGIYASLVLCGIITIDDMKSYMNGNKKMEEIPLGRPVVPFYDYVNRHLYYKYNISKIQIDKLFKGIYLDAKKCNEFIEKARILYQYQYTFKKYIEEWNSYIIRYGKFEEMLEESMEKAISINTPKQLTLMIIILSSFNRLQVKWSLQKEQSFENEEIYEVLNAITEGLFTKEECIGLIHGELSKQQWDLMITNCNINMNKKELKNQYDILQGDNSISYSELEQLINTYLDTSCVEEKLTDYYIPFYINKSLQNMKKQKEFILDFWKNGFSVNWNLYIGAKEFKKVDLPEYCFDEEKYWNDQTIFIPVEKCVKQQWVAEDLNEKVKDENSHNIVVFFHGHENEIKKQFNEKYKNSQIYYIKMESSNDQQMMQRKLMFADNVSEVYYFTQMETEFNKNYSVTDFLFIQEREYNELLSAIKVLSICGYTQRKIILNIIINNVNEIEQGEECFFMHYGINGLAHSVAKKFMEWNVKIFDIDLNDSVNNNLDLLFQEKSDNYCCEVVYRNGKRYIRNSSGSDKIIFDDIIEYNKNNSVKEVLFKILEEILYVQPDDVLMDASFLDLGMDSITELEMIKSLNKKLNIKLMTTDLFVYDTVDDLVNYIITEF